MKIKNKILFEKKLKNISFLFLQFKWMILWRTWNCWFHNIKIILLIWRILLRLINNFSRHYHTSGLKPLMHIFWVRLLLLLLCLRWFHIYWWIICLLNWLCMLFGNRWIILLGILLRIFYFWRLWFNKLLSNWLIEQLRWSIFDHRFRRGILGFFRFCFNIKMRIMKIDIRTKIWFRLLKHWLINHHIHQFTFISIQSLIRFLWKHLFFNNFLWIKDQNNVF